MSLTVLVMLFTIAQVPGTTEMLVGGYGPGGRHSTRTGVVSQYAG